MFEVLPDSYAEIIFYFGGCCSIDINGKLQPLPSPFLTGLLDKPIVFHTQDRLEVIGIRCYPWAVFDLLGLVSGKPPIRVFEHPVSQLQSSLQELLDAGDIAGALSCLSTYVVNMYAPLTLNDIVLKAGAALSVTKGALPVSKVATMAHASLRNLERQFKRSSGYTIKDVAGLMRFEQVRDRIWCNPDVGLAALAQEFGYSDQSHLGREFKRYSQTTPLAFARKAKQHKSGL